MRDRDVEQVSLRQLMLKPPDEDDTAHFLRALEAGARGDLRACLDHELSGTVVVESPHRFILQELLDQEQTAPAWAFSRWALDLAYRWMLFSADPRTDAAVLNVMAALYPDSLNRALGDQTELRLLGTHLAAGDHLVPDLALFEFGGLAHYLDKVAEPGLLDRTDGIRQWADAPMGAYEFIDLRGCRLVLRSLVDSSEVAVLNIGSTSGGPHEALLGRLVPISSEPGLMFAAHPMSVDLATAASVADALRYAVSPQAWLAALSGALRGGRAREGFHRTPNTWFTSDLPVPEIVVDTTEHGGDEAERITELRAKGYSFEVANALAVLEVGLIAAGVSDRSAAAAGPHVSAALATPGAFEAAERECTGPGTATAWLVLAAVVPDHLSGRCRELARLAA